MMIDVSHVFRQNVWDIVNTSTKPGSGDAFRLPRDCERAAQPDGRKISRAGETAGRDVIFYPEHIEPG